MTKTSTNKKKEVFIITLVLLTFLVITGFGLRILNLGEPGFGTDEPLHVYAAKSILENGKPELPSGVLYNRALLYTKTVALSFKFLGFNEFAARLPSVIFGSLTIALLFFIGKKFFGTRVGLISAFLVAFIPFQIAWSRECRMYTMFQFFFLAGVFAFYNGLERITDSEIKNSERFPKKRLYLFRYFYSLKVDWKWIFISVILLYVSFSLQSLTAIYGPSLIFYLILMSVLVLVNQSFREFLSSKYLFFLSLITVTCIVALLISPDILLMVKSHLFFKPHWASRLKFNPIYYITLLTSTPFFPLGVFLVLGSVQVITHKNKTGIYTLICIVVPLIILSFIPTMVRGKRYIFNIIPLIILMASYSINNLFHSESGRITDLLSKNNLNRYKKVTSYIIIALILLYTSTPWAYYNYRIIFDYYGDDNNLAMGHRNWRQACDYVATFSKPGDVTIPSEPLTVHYYGCENIQYYIANDNTHQRQFSVNDEKRISEIEDLKYVVSNNSRGWVIVDSGRFYSSLRMSKDLREFIFNNLTYHDVGKDRTVLIFSWDERNISRL